MMRAVEDEELPKDVFQSKKLSKTHHFTHPVLIKMMKYATVEEKEYIIDQVGDTDVPHYDNREFKNIYKRVHYRSNKQ